MSFYLHLKVGGEARRDFQTPAAYFNKRKAERKAVDSEFRKNYSSPLGITQLFDETLRVGTCDPPNCLKILPPSAPHTREEHLTVRPPLEPPPGGLNKQPGIPNNPLSSLAANWLTPERGEISPLP